MIQSPCPFWHAWGCDCVLQELHQNLLQSCGAQRAPQTQGGLFVVSVLVSGTAGQSCCFVSMYQDLHPQERFPKQCQTLELGFSDWMDGTAMRLKRS